MDHNIERLRSMIAPAGSGCRCALDDGFLCALLERYPCYELAAYHACLTLAQDDSLALPDGTKLPAQRAYWLSRAAELRPTRTGLLRRADEVTV